MEAIISKIQKLLALGERGGTEAEAEAAMQKVHELLAKHNLSLGDVKDAPATEEDYVQDFTDATNRQPWQDYIWTSVAQLYFCRHFKRIRGNHVQHMIIGKPSNIAAVKYVSMYLIRTANALAAKAAASSNSKRLFINSFKKGFASRIASRVTEEIKKARDGKMMDSATGTALLVLPLYDQATRDIDRFLMDNQIRPRSGSSRMSVSDSNGYYAGREAANSVSLTSNGLGQTAEVRRLK